MITVQPYINKLEALKIWVELRINEKFLHEEILQYFFETGQLLSLSASLLPFEEWYEKYQKEGETVFIQTFIGYRVVSPKVHFYFNDKKLGNS